MQQQIFLVTVGLGAGDDGIPVISADDPAYANETGDGRITLIDG